MNADQDTVGVIAQRLARLDVRLTATCLPVGTRRVWRVSIHDGRSGALLRVSESESILDALSMAVATS